MSAKYRKLTAPSLQTMTAGLRSMAPTLNRNARSHWVRRTTGR